MALSAVRKNPSGTGTASSTGTNLGELAEDRDSVLSQARTKLLSFNQSLLLKTLDSYGSMATRKRVREWVNG